MLDDNDHQDLKTDIALIKKDIIQMGETFKKIDNAIIYMMEIAKTLAIQERIIDMQIKRSDLLDIQITDMKKIEAEFQKSLSKHLDVIKSELKEDNMKIYKDILQRVENLDKKLETRLGEHTKQIGELNRWKWWVMGAAGVIGLIVAKIPLANILAFFL